MEKFQPKVNLKSLKNPRIDQYALQQVLKLVGATREYLVGDKWLKTVSQRPDAARVTFPDIFSFRKAREGYFAWLELNQLSGREKPEFPEKIIERLMVAAYNPSQPLIFFIPWGYRPYGEFGPKEVNAMDRITLAANTVGQRQIPLKVLLMPADVYAVEINGEDLINVEKYFTCVTQAASLRGFEVVPWSQIRLDNFDWYSTLRKFYTNDQIERLLPLFVINSAIKAAQRRNRSNKEAYDYLRERLCEATIIEEIYKPVKLSMVAKNKDNGVDLNLPRLYLIPESLQFPWL